jgi:hypothetical protein
LSGATHLDGFLLSGDDPLVFQVGLVPGEGGRRGEPGVFTPAAHVVVEQFPFGGDDQRGPDLVELGAVAEPSDHVKCGLEPITEPLA